MRTAIVALLLMAGVLAGRAAESEGALVARAQAALQARDGPTAEGLYRQLTALAPANWTYLQGLADAESMQGKYADAIAAYAKAIPPALAAGDDKSRWAAGAMLVGQGNAYLKLHKNAEAMADYAKAAPLAQNPAVAWFNVCAVAYNTGNVPAAKSACDRAIAADPNKADAYFIKGSLMVGDSTVGPNGKMIPPKGTVEILQKYLALAPNGAHVKDVKEMLDAVR